MKVLFSSIGFMLTHLVLVNAQLASPHNQWARFEKILGITPQSTEDQNVGDKCFLNLGPCDLSSRYRTLDGSCNNFNFPMWGMANSALIRVRPASYSDKRTLPRQSVHGGPLPNSRELRLKLLPDVGRENRDFWTLFLSWTQFIAHDMAHITPKVNGVSCCTAQGRMKDPFSKLCYPIPVSKKDPFYHAFNVDCIDMFRSRTLEELGCRAVPVDSQIVDVTHFIDASPVYGSSVNVSFSLRQFHKGLLRSQSFRGESFPPNVENPRATCDIRNNDAIEVCYKAGDTRVNQNILLTPLHVIFLRVHNLIALELGKVNPYWNDETLFQETRRIVIAIVQLITYKEMLPILVGDTILKKTGLYVHPLQGLEGGYDPNVNPSTISEFCNTAFKSLHSMLVPKVSMMPSNFASASVNLVDWSLRPQIVQRFFTAFMRGQKTQFVEAFDKFESASINNLLFKQTKPYGLDLEALSIQRQQDFGTPSYNDFRIYSQLPRARNFDDLRDLMDRKNIELLKGAFKSVDDIDLFTGGLYERPVPGALMGVTFWKVIVDQFARWKFGDRFFFTFGGQAGSFTSAQLAEIMKVSSGWLFCAASDDIQRVFPNSMNAKLPNNPEVPCSYLPKLDWNKWKA